ncbi:MAG TPA: hypothetical protein VHG33_05360, partial [Woeseiaceae bacterium]|nr:hypothetical protein [Woeseiaceae bacterium]
MTKATAIGLAAACLIAGCATAQSPSAGDETPETPARLALDIVARHLSVEPGELELMRVEPMRWR